MATDKLAQPDEEPLDATEAEWEDEDPTVGEAIVPYEGGIVPRAQWDLPAVFEAFGGVPLWTHDSTKEKPKPALHYKIPNRGEGLTARTMRILSAMRGGFEEVDLNVREGVSFEPVIGPDGKVVVEKVPAIEATVRIRDLSAGNVRIGVSIEPMVKLRDDKKSYYLVPMPRENAIAKAKRNGYAEHFAAIIEPLLVAFMRECREGRETFSGEVPPNVRQAFPQKDDEGAPVPSAADHKRQRAEAAIGTAGRDEIVARLKPLQATFGEAIRDEFLKWGTETFGTNLIRTWPARRMKEVDAWFAEKAEKLGETLDGGRVVGDAERPDAEEDPFADAPATPLAHVPTETDVRNLIAGTSKELVAEAYKRAGLSPTKPLDTPEKCQKMHQALLAVRPPEGETRPGEEA